MEVPANRRFNREDKRLRLCVDFGLGVRRRDRGNGGARRVGAGKPADPAPEKYARLPAFPGAEGFGMFVTGGRGGEVYTVTNLNDAGPDPPRRRFPRPPHGRFRRFRHDRAQVADQRDGIRYHHRRPDRAPGDGICLRDNQFGVGGKNIIVRYIRSRLGDVSHKEDDSLEVNNGASDIIYDHCSASWAIDECFSTSGRETNVTIQWCLIAQGLTDSFHAKGPHGYGSLARSNGNVSWIYNMWAETLERNPRLGDVYGQGRPNFEVRNNVVYNYGRVAAGLIQGNINVDYVNNYIRPGPVSDRKATAIHTPGPTDTSAMPSEMTFFIKGNVWEGDKAAGEDNTKFFDHTAVPNRLTVHFAPASVVTAPPIPPGASVECRGGVQESARQRWRKPAGARPGGCGHHPAGARRHRVADRQPDAGRRLAGTEICDGFGDHAARRHPR